MSPLCLLGVVAILALLTCAIGLGDLALVRTRLQATADATAVAGATTLGSGGLANAAADQNFEVGLWDSATRTFVNHPAGGNAVRAVARQSGEPRLAARWLGHKTWQASTTAVATVSPRDLVFVVDVSGSMNDETEPAWCADAMGYLLNTAPSATPAAGWIAELYADLGFGAYPGELQTIGGTLGINGDDSVYARLTADDGPLFAAEMESYRIFSTDSASERKQKAYRWIMDQQLARLMPAARPPVDSSRHYDYWEKYLDYVIAPCSVKQQSDAERDCLSLPPGQSRARLERFNNPNQDNYPAATAGLIQQWRNQVGYLTYAQFMLDHGRNGKVAGRHTPLSTASADCPWHLEKTVAGELRFPPRTQPMHGTRRALIAAIHEIKQRSQHLSKLAGRDRVAVITFDGLQEGGPVIVQPLTDDYDAAMQVCAGLEAATDLVEATAIDAGLLTAQAHLLPPAQAGAGRVLADKVIVLLSDGVTNQTVRDAGEETISVAALARAAALEQAQQIRERHWQLVPVACGVAANRAFIQELAGSPSESSTSKHAPFEHAATDTMLEMIAHPRVRLVQ